MSEEVNQVPPISCINPNSSHSSERSSAKNAMAVKREDELVIQVDSPPLVPPLVDCVNFAMDLEAGTTDKMQEGNVLGDKELLSQDDASLQAEETQGDKEK